MARPKKITTTELNGKEVECLELTDGTKVVMVDTDLREQLYTAYNQKLTSGETDRKSWISCLVSENLNAIKKHIKDDPSASISAIRTLTKIVDDTQNYFDSKNEENTDFSKYLLRESLFYYQREVFDENMHKKKALCWGRRSGKSTLCSRLAIKHCLESDASKKKREVIIIGLTIEKTKELYWTELQDTLKLCHIKGCHIDNSNYRITWPNGNFIQLWGNNSKADREKLRGKDTSMFIIDEMQSQNGLYTLLTDIIGPILKGRDGELVCVGTGPLSGGTEWERILSDDAYFHSSANMTMNPTIVDHEQALEKVLLENHWTEDTPTFQREYLGKICFDTDLMIWPFAAYGNIPQNAHIKKVIIGIDLGFADDSAIIPLFITDDKMYVAHEWSKNRCDSETIFNQLTQTKNDIMELYHVPASDIVMVTDTNEQNMTRTWYNRGLFELVNAVKHPLDYSIGNLNSGLRTKILLTEDGPCDIDHKCTVYKRDLEHNTIVYEEDKNVYHANAMHALRYAYDYYTDEEALK